jgi:hypothetical protein
MDVNSKLASFVQFSEVAEEALEKIAVAVEVSKRQWSPGYCAC